MKFIVGLATGLVLGAAGAIAYSVKTGTDLREAYEGVRSDIEKRDLDALSARLESGLTELQAVMDERMNQIKASTANAIEEANKAIEDSRAKASSAVESTNGFSEVADDAADAAEAAVATATSIADDAADAVEETLDVAADTVQDAREG